MDTDTIQAVALRELDALRRDFPGWGFWRGHDGHGQLHGWHATRTTPDGSVVVVADNAAQLRLRVDHLEAQPGRA